MIKRYVSICIVTLLFAVNIPELLHHHECSLTFDDCPACVITKNISETGFLDYNFNQVLLPSATVRLIHTDIYLLHHPDSLFPPRAPPAL